MKKIINSLLIVSLLGFGVSIAAPIGHSIEYQSKQQIIKVEGANNTRTIKAKEGDKIVIEGVNNKITIVGNAAELKVEGANNTVNAAGIIKIDIEGTNNMINASQVDVINVEGAGNHAHYKSTSAKDGIAKVKTEGVNNMIKKIK